MTSEEKPLHFFPARSFMFEKKKKEGGDSRPSKRQPNFFVTKKYKTTNR